jgi:hypothetical protein
VRSIRKFYVKKSKLFARTLKIIFKEKLLIFQGNSSVVGQETPFRKFQACSGAKSLHFEIHTKYEYAKIDNLQE